VSICAARKTIKLIPSRQYDDQISGHSNWLQSVIGIPNPTSDVLLVLDYYVEAFSRGDVEKLITHLSDNEYRWARYGIIAAGYTQNSLSPGEFSDCFLSTLEDLFKTARELRFCNKEIEGGTTRVWRRYGASSNGERWQWFYYSSSYPSLGLKPNNLR
jgi:hypothetical protein